MHIGFFDSGLGGLFVLRQVAQELPEYNYIFLGDTVNVPYGTKSDEEIYLLVTQALRALFERDCKLVIFACNTASVTALPRIQQEFMPRFFPDRKVLGVIIPTVEEVINAGTKRLAIIGTERTIASGKYLRELEKLNAEIEVHCLPTPSLVPLMESGKLEAAEKEAVALVQRHLLSARPDTLILGCTHYSLIKETLRAAFPSLRILSQDEIIGPKLKLYLKKHPEIETALDKKSKREFWLSAITPHYTEHIRAWYGDVPVSLHTLSSGV